MHLLDKIPSPSPVGEAQDSGKLTMHRKRTVFLPETLTVRVGDLEIVAGTPCMIGGAHVKVDGKLLAVRSLKLEGSVDSAWRATIEYFSNIEIKR